MAGKSNRCLKVGKVNLILNKFTVAAYPFHKNYAISSSPTSAQDSLRSISQLDNQDRIRSGYFWTYYL